jgi:hypothetical protein
MGREVYRMRDVGGQGWDRIGEERNGRSWRGNERRGVRRSKVRKGRERNEKRWTSEGGKRRT